MSESENSVTNKNQVAPADALLPFIETPIEKDSPRITPPVKSVAGFPAVYSSLKHGFREMGLLRTAKALTKLNQKDGFDCPSCAWPDPDDRRALAEFCENGAKAVADEATNKRVTPVFFAEHSIYQLSEQSDFELGKNGRITNPMVKRRGSAHYEALSWGDAFAMIAEKLNSLVDPNEASFYTSGRTSNEAAFVYQLFARLYGTNNLPDCSNMCHESSGTGLGEQIGIGKGTVKLDDFNHADCIVVAGQNPGTNHPRMLTALQKAVRNGCKIISINPLREPGLVSFQNPQEVGGMLGLGTALASLHLPVRINGDVALLKGIMKEMLELEKRTGPGIVLNLDFIQKSTIGFEEFAADLQAEDWNAIVRESGVSRELINEAASILAQSKRTIACWAMGLTQHKNAVANIQVITDLLLLRGQIGRPGAGVCPVRGHSNVQGDRTMGIFEKMPEAFHDSLDREFSFQSPRQHGFDTVDTLKAMHEKRVKVFFGMGGNFLAATPDTAYTAQALRNCELTVHVSTKLNRAHLITGDLALILPCLGRTEIDLQESGEQFVSCEDSMGVVHSSRGTLQAGSEELKSEVAIVCGLAQAVFKHQPEKLKIADWQAMTGNYDVIRNHIERVIKGFNNFNERIRHPGGFYLPNSPRDLGQFENREKKARFMTHPIAKTIMEPNRFLLMTIRSHDQFNTTIYGLDDRYRGVSNGRRVIFMNSDDMREQGLADSNFVTITSHFKNESRTAAHFRVIPYEIPRQCVAVYYPEGNVLVPIDSMADRSRTPAYKSVIVSLALSPEAVA
jgi:molybdopterin-dependent oxidoreductase alpha subunit